MSKPTPQKKDISEPFLWVFRVGIFCILVSALLFLVGFATDHWHKDKYSYYGLWNQCEHGKCSSHELSSLPVTPFYAIEDGGTWLHLALMTIRHWLLVYPFYKSAYCVQTAVSSPPRQMRSDSDRIIDPIYTDQAPDYHIATQALQIVAATIYTLAPVIHFFVYCAKKQKSTDYRTRIFETGYVVGTVLHVLGVIVFGSLHPNADSLSWSYYMSIAGAGLAVVGTILVIVSRKKALRFFHFLPRSKQKRRKGRVDALSQNSTGSSRADTPQSVSSSVSRNVFGPQTRQSIDSQSSILVAVPNYLNQSDSYRNVSPGPSNEIPFRTLSVNTPQKQLGVTDPVLHYPNNPSTSKLELAPLRTHFLPPLHETTPV